MSIAPISAPHSGSVAWNKMLDTSATKQTDSAPIGKARKETPADIKKAAGQFEAIILRQLLSPAIEPIMNGGLGGAAGTGGGVYGYMLTDTLADSLSKGGGLGLTSMLSRQLTPRGIPPVKTETPVVAETPVVTTNATSS